MRYEELHAARAIRDSTVFLGFLLGLFGQAIFDDPLRDRRLSAKSDSLPEKRWTILTWANGNPTVFLWEDELFLLGQMGYDTTIPQRIRLRWKWSKLRLLMRSIRLRYDYDTITTKNWHVHFLLASNCVDWKQARAIRRSRIVVGKQCKHDIRLIAALLHLLLLILVCSSAHHMCHSPFCRPLVPVIYWLAGWLIRPTYQSVLLICDANYTELHRASISNWRSALSRRKFRTVGVSPKPSSAAQLLYEHRPIRHWPPVLLLLLLQPFGTLTHIQVDALTILTI